MSISNRLDEIEARPVAWPWPWLDRTVSDKAALLSAVRAVLDYVDYHDDEGWSAWPDGVRRAIATALECDEHEL